MNIIKFIRLLFYHIYLYYYKVDKESKTSAKIATWLVLTVVFIILVDGGFNLGYQLFDNNYIGINGKSYIIMCFVIGIITAYYMYKEDFDDLDMFINYHPKYYFYFFSIVLLFLFVEIYSIQINRGRIDKQEENRKMPINIKNNTSDIYNKSNFFQS